MEIESEYHIGEEFRQQQAEGKRRQRIYEGVDLETLQSKGGCIGAHKMAGAGLPMAEAVVAAAAESDTFSIWPHDKSGLLQELRDLDRDIDVYEKAQGVKFDV